MNVGMRIKKRRKEIGLSVDELAKRLGKNRATIYRYESSEIENMPLDIIEPLAEVLKVSPAYLMGWEKEDKPKILTSSYKFIPNPISAGLPIDMEGLTEYQKIEVSDEVMGKWAGDKEVFFIRVNGDSMDKVIPHGSLIAVKPVEKQKINNGDIIVFSENGDYSVKRFYKEEDTIIFRPDSHDPSFYDYITNVYNDDLIIHGKVVAYIVELE